jgi:hypothetical protein
VVSIRRTVLGEVAEPACATVSQLGRHTTSDWLFNEAVSVQLVSPCADGYPAPVEIEH